MKTILVLLLVMVMVPVCLSGCNSGKDVVVSCDEFEKQQNAAAEVTVSQGETVTVILCSNASTGFTWDESAKIEHDNILKQTGHEFISPQKAMPGASGQEKWTFKALGSGTSTAYFEYSRPWEGGEKGVWTFTLTVIVK
jgi:inhibitor of cysteine peptidase